MSKVDPLGADQYEEVGDGPGKDRTVGFNDDSDDAGPQPLSPQYINSNKNNNKRGNGVVENNARAIHDKSAQSSSDDQGKALKIIIYGAVNAMMAIPILYGYAAIIFRYSSCTLDIYVCVTEQQHSTSTSSTQSSRLLIIVCGVFLVCGNDLRYLYA